MKKSLIFFFFAITFSISAQNTLKFEASKGSPKATINQVSWIAGYWTGKAMGGLTEEVWTTPLGGSMMGSFKLVINNSIQFYELCTISQEKETILLRIKHFNKDLQGWEEKDESEEFKLVKLKTNKAYFDGITFVRKKDQLSIFVVIDNEEVEFKYKLKK